MEASPRARTSLWLLCEPKIMSFSRKKRIAMGSGTTLQDINSLIKEFEMMNKMMKEFKNNKKFARKMKGMFKQ